MDRRTWLSYTLTSPWIFGMTLLHQDPQSPSSRPSPKDQDSFAKALQAMQQLQAPCIAIALPETKDQPAVANVLNDWLDVFRQPPATRALFGRAVWLVAPRNRLPLRDGETAVLLDPTGARVTATSQSFLRTEAEYPAIVEVLHGLIDAWEGPRQEKLSAKQSESARRDLTNAHRLRVVQKPNESVGPELTAAYQRIAEQIRPGAYVLWAWRTADVELRLTCETAMLYRHATPALPFGVQETPLPNTEDACPACGMAICSRRASVSLRFLGQ